MGKCGKRIIYWVDMFRGTHENTIDDKGRVSFPAPFRSLLPEEDARLVITNYIPAHLWAFTFEHWAQLENKIKSLPLTDETARKFKHFFIAGAHEVTIDKLGRVLIPPRLREYAQLGKNIAFVGSVTHVEIWSKENWDSAFAVSSSEFEKVARKIDLGF